MYAILHYSVIFNEYGQVSKTLKRSVKMNKTLILIGAFAIILLQFGCGTTAKFVYPARMESLVQVASQPVYDAKVAIVPFDDFRNQRNQETAMLLYYVPLFPFGWVEYDRPDAARTFLSVNEFQFTPAEDLPKAAAVSLRRSNLFKDAFFTFGGEKDNADFVLYGALKSTKYKGTMIGYGLSIYGVLPWVIGAPAGISENDLALELVLKKKNKVIWEYTFNRSRDIWQWLYYRMGHDVLGYSELMQECMNEAITDLSHKLRNNPELLK